MRVPLEWLQRVLPARAGHGDPGAAADDDRHQGRGDRAPRRRRARQLHRRPRASKAEQHPDADRLRVCLVDIGDGEPSQIVCGAPNVAAGQTVAVAKPGAVMPDGTDARQGEAPRGRVQRDDPRRGRARDRDRPRRGSWCSRTITSAPGHAARKRCSRSRPTCSSSRSPRTGPTASRVYGIAREAHAATGRGAGRRRRGTRTPARPARSRASASQVEDPDLCPRFTARVFEDVKIGPSPPWLKARLMAAGQRPISNVVDITNYVMLLTGQPLHAFDLDRIAGGTPHGQTRAATGEQVADPRRPDAHARRPDGADRRRRRPDLDRGRDGRRPLRGLADDTTRVLMEAATWDGPNIHRTAWTLGLQSEASLRFEKQLQPEQAMDAQAVATQADGRGLRRDAAGTGRSTSAATGPPPATIRLRDARVAGLLGAPIPRERCDEILRLARVRHRSRPPTASTSRPPYFRRGDVTREADVIEEVARLDGLEKLPVDAAEPPRRLRPAHPPPAPAPPRRRRARRAGAVRGGRVELRRRRAAATAAARGRRRCVELENPMSAEQATSADDAARLAARRRAAQSRARRDDREAVRGGRGVPADAGERPPARALPRRRGADRRRCARRAGATPDPPQADFFAAKGALEGLLACACARPTSSSRRS